MNSNEKMDWGRLLSSKRFGLEDYDDDKPLFIGFMIIFAVAWWILLPLVIFGAIGFIIYKKFHKK